MTKNEQQIIWNLQNVYPKMLVQIEQTYRELNLTLSLQFHWLGLRTILEQNLGILKN
jgi:hypothetical protein